MIGEINIDQLREDIRTALLTGQGPQLASIVYQEFEGRGLGNPMRDGEGALDIVLSEGPPDGSGLPLCGRCGCDPEPDTSIYCDGCWGRHETRIANLTNRICELTGEDYLDVEDGL